LNDALDVFDAGNRNMKMKRRLISPAAADRRAIRKLATRLRFCEDCCFGGFLRRTRGPPPFSSMNSTPAASRPLSLSTDVTITPCEIPLYKKGQKTPANISGTRAILKSKYLK